MMGLFDTHYEIKPAKYAKNKLAIHLTQPTMFALRCLIERSLQAEGSWSGREGAYIVSHRKAEHFRLLVKYEFGHYSGDRYSECPRVVRSGLTYTIKDAIDAIKSGQFEVEEFLNAVDGV